MKKQNPVLQRLTPNVSRPSTAFDRGHRTNFTLNGGQLVPLFSKFVPAGTKFKINRSVFLRTNMVNTAAFSEMNFCLDFYKVPIKLLVSNWGAMQTMTQDVNSVLMQNANGSFNVNLPKLNPDWIENQWFQNWPYFGRATGTPTNGKVDTARLFDYLNTGWVDWSDRESGQTYPIFRNNGISQNMLSFAAYQKIYFDHYRNTMYEKNDPFAYNLDDIVANGTWPTTASDQIARFSKLMQLRYVNLRNDFFGNIYPSLYGYQSAFMMNRANLMPNNILGFGFTSNPVNPEVIASPIFEGLQGSVYTSPNSSVEVGDVITGSSANMTSVQNIRAAFALDKLLRLSNRTKQHVIDQYAARFGVAPKNEAAMESDYLGSFQNDIQIGEVLQQTNTESTGTNLGAVGGVGRGAAPRERTISGFADSDCYIMGIAYVVPKINYDALMVDAFNVKSAPSDFFQPEFENMGLQPIYQWQLRSYSLSESEIADDINNQILGYQPRYSEYKISIDENHSLFMPGNELSAFVTHTSRERDALSTTTDGVNLRYFKVLPQYLNDIFVEQVNEDSMPFTDQFFGTLHVDFDVIQKMSATGEPSL